MSWIAAAIIGGAVIGGGASYLSSQAQSGAARDAAQTSANATTTAADLQYKLGMESLDLQRPFYEAGQKLLPSQVQAGLQAYGQTLPMMSQVAMNPQNNPLTNLQLSTSTQQLNNALSARGLYNSGAGLQAISGANQGILANAENNQWNRLTQLYGLQTGNTAAIGAGAASNAAAGLNSTGSGMASTYMSGSGQQQQAILAGGLAQGNMYQNMGGLGMGMAQGGLYNYTLQNALNQGGGGWNLPYGSGGGID